MIILGRKLYPALAMLLSLATVPGVLAQSADYDNADPIVATIAGYSARGMVSVLGEGQATAVRTAYPGSNVVYEPGNPAGSFVAVVNGEREFALETVIEMKLADEGAAPFTESYAGKYSLVTALSPNLSLAHAYGRAEFLDENNIKTFQDIKDRKIPVRLGINQPGNLWARAHVHAILAQFDLTVEEIVANGGTLIEQSTGPTMELMKDGRVDIEITGGFVPIGSMIELNSVTQLRFLPLTSEQAKGAADAMGIAVGVIPAGSYDFQTEELSVPASTHYIIAGPKATDEQVFKLAKALDKELSIYQAMHPALAAITKEQIVPEVDGIPVHPAAAAYYSSR